MREVLHQIFDEGFGLLKLSDSDGTYRVGSIRWIKDNKKGQYQLELLTQKQAMHESLTKEAAIDRIEELLECRFKQLNVVTAKHQFQVRISKQGKWLVHKKAVVGVSVEPQTHNRDKDYLLKGHVSLPMIDLGIMTSDGKLVDKMQDKYRQINRFLELVDDALKKYPKRELRIIDFGCGKSYLTFVLYDYLVNVKGYQVEIIGLDLKADVIALCNSLALKYHYDHLRFLCQDIKDYDNSAKVDMVISLHACDTASDYALFAGIKWEAPLIFCVPCCQHELNNQLMQVDYPLFSQYGLIKERMSALLTDAIRGELLEVMGYQVQMVEFVDFTHSPKNIMIRAVKGKQKKAIGSLLKLQQDFHGELTLYRLLKDHGYVA